MAQPLSTPPRMLLLRLSLARCVAHLQRMVPWCRLEAATRRVERSLDQDVAVDVLLQLDPNGEGWSQRPSQALR